MPALFYDLSLQLGRSPFPLIAVKPTEFIQEVARQAVTPVKQGGIGAMLIQ